MNDEFKAHIIVWSNHAEIVFFGYTKLKTQHGEKQQALRISLPQCYERMETHPLNEGFKQTENYMM